MRPVCDLSEGARVVQIFGETAEEKKARGDNVFLLQLDEVLNGFGNGWRS